MTAQTPPTPRQPVPALDLPLVGGGRWSLGRRDPEAFSMLIFYRGLHCPICKGQLTEAQSQLDEFAKRGVEIVAISTDDAERAEKTKAEWGLDRLDIAHGLTLDQARGWGLYISSQNGEHEPARFSEPGLFLVRPDGTLYYAAIQSMPFGRPAMSDLLGALDFVLARDYPARGELAA